MKNPHWINLLGLASLLVSFATAPARGDETVTVGGSHAVAASFH